MARMMHWFRKYQYILLVVFGVLLMIVFVVGDALQSLTPSYDTRRPSDDVVLTWKGGKLTSGDLYNLRVQNNLAMEFLNAIVQETTKRNGSPKGMGTQLSLAQTDEELIRKLLLAAKAEEIGLKIDNEAVFDMLYELADGELTRNDLGVIFNQVFGQRRGFSQQRLMDQLKQEMLAQQMLMLSQASIVGRTGPVLPPYEAWELHNRMRRRVKTEMVALKVDDFKSQVSSQPTEAEIVALYESAKDRFPDPSSPEPGFRRRPKAAFEYVRADFSKFLEEEVAKIQDTITDADIEAYYNENKERYRVLDLPGSLRDSLPGGAGTSSDATPPEINAPQTAPANGRPEPSPADPSPADPSPADPSPADPSPADPAPAAEEPAKGTDDKASAPPANDAPASEAPASDPPAEDASVSQPPTEQPAAGDASAAEQPQAGWRRLRDGSVFAVLADDTAEPVADDTASQEPAAEPASAAAAPPAAEPSAEANPGTPPDAASTTEQEPSASAAPTAEETAASSEAAPVAAEPAAPAPATPEKAEPKYKPLDDALRAEIRRTLATERARRPAQERLDKVFNDVSSAIESYGRQLRLTEISPETKKPEPVDVVSLISGPGLTAGKTDLVDPLGIEEYDLGRAYETMFTSWPPQRVPFAAIAFQEGLQLYRPQRISGAQLDEEFLFWKTQQEPSYVPELKDIREEVIDAWKRRQALGLAKAEAERLAQRAAGDKPLSESLGSGVHVLQPLEFSWMTTGFTPFGGGAPALSTIEGVPNAGEKFMEAVFALRPGETGVAVNQPQDTVYVVRVVEETPGDEALRQQFLAGGVTNEVAQMAFVELGRLWQHWYDDLEKEFKVVRKN